MLEILTFISLVICLMVSGKLEVKKSVRWIEVPQSQPVQHIEFQAIITSPKIKQLSFQLEIEKMREEYQLDTLRKQFQMWKENCDAIDRCYMTRSSA